MEMIITNANLVLSDGVCLGTVVIRDGKIAQIDEGQSTVPTSIDFEGDYLLPGLVELHTDNLERHAMPRPGVIWPVGSSVINHDREIVSSGITTVCNAMSVGLIDLEVHRAEFLTTLFPAIEQQRKENNLKADHLLHLRCEISTDNLIEQLEPLIDSQGLCLMSIMDHTPGQRQFVTEEASHAYYKKKYGMDDYALAAFLKKQLINQERYAEKHRAFVVEAAHKRNIVIASHDDATVEHVEEAKRDGITVAEFPTTVESAKACHEANIAVMMGGPNIVRGKSHSGNVSGRHLAELGLLDIISSDYAPSSLLISTFILAEHIEGMDLPKAIRAAATIPAQKIGLNDRGEIAEGKRADLIRVKLSQSVPVVREVWCEGLRVC